MYILPLTPVIKKWNNINISIFPPTNCVAIVPFNGKLDSTLGISKITKFIRDITYLNTKSLDIFIGLLLGDAYFKLGKNNINIRIGFKQSIINFPFFWLVFNDLSHYCASVPRFEYAKIKDKKYGQLILDTRTYPVLNILYELFIDNNIKIIKYDMFHYLSPIALSYWIMSDGTSSQYGLTICTDNFTIKDNIRLINILKIRYDLNCSLHSYAGRPRIYIKADSMDKLRKIVEPYIIPFSNYKLKKGKRPIL